MTDLVSLDPESTTTGLTKRHKISNQTRLKLTAKTNPTSTNFIIPLANTKKEDQCWPLITHSYPTNQVFSQDYLLKINQKSVVRWLRPPLELSRRNWVNLENLCPKSTSKIIISKEIVLLFHTRGPNLHNWSKFQAILVRLYSKSKVERHSQLIQALWIGLLRYSQPRVRQHRKFSRQNSKNLTFKIIIIVTLGSNTRKTSCFQVKKRNLKARLKSEDLLLVEHMSRISRSERRAKT